MKIKTTKITTANLTTVPSAIREALEVEAGGSIDWFIETLLDTGIKAGELPTIVKKQAVIVRKAETKK